MMPESRHSHESAYRLDRVTLLRSGRVVLEDVNLELPASSVTVLMGPSAAGKTSLLHLLNRLGDPTDGEIRYRGVLIEEYEVTELRCRVGYVFQTPVMFAGTVRDNLQIAAQLASVGESEFAQRAAKTLALAELEESLLERTAAELSVGQQQRVNIARSLMANPETLLLDEPTAALDPDTSRGLLGTIDHLADQGDRTIVLTTHRPDEALQVADQAVLLRNGRVARVGEPNAVLAEAFQS